MKWEDWLFHWHADFLKVNKSFLDREISFSRADRDAAWEIYVELLTRLATQPVSEEGDERTGLASIYKLFAIFRDVLRRSGRDAKEVTKLTLLFLNQVIRPFTTYWYKLSLSGAFNDRRKSFEFHEDLKNLQEKMRIYASMLAEIAETDNYVFLSE